MSIKFGGATVIYIPQKWVPEGGSILLNVRRPNGSTGPFIYSQSHGIGVRIASVFIQSTSGGPALNARDDAYGTSSVPLGIDVPSDTNIPRWLINNFAADFNYSGYYGSTTEYGFVSNANPDFANANCFTLGGLGYIDGTGNFQFTAQGIFEIAEAWVYNRKLVAQDFTDINSGAKKPEQLTGMVDGIYLLDKNNLTTINGLTFIVAGDAAGLTNGTQHPVNRATPVPVSFSGPVPTRNGVLGTAATFVNAGFFAGNLTPFTYSSVGSALPAGITLNTSTGALSQAASGVAAGTTSGIIIRATDTGGNVANTNAYSIVIAATNSAPTFPGNIGNISGTAGSAIAPVNVSGQFSDTDALTYTASPTGTAWPAGLVVNSSTGIISGTVAAGTTTGLKVRATDTGNSFVDSNAFNVVITATATRTWTPTIKLEALADETPFANWAVHAVINDMAGNLIGTKTGLTTSSAGLPPPFTSSFGSLATDYRVTYVDDTDLTIFAVENLRCV